MKAALHAYTERRLCSAPQEGLAYPDKFEWCSTKGGGDVRPPGRVNGLERNGSDEVLWWDEYPADGSKVV